MDCKTITLFLLLLSLPVNLQCTESPKWIRGGYWDSVSELPISEINSALFIHLMRAFATINSTTFNIFINSTYEQSFSNFTSTVKRKNPSVVTILSIRGGKQNSETFSSMINQSAYRKSFIKSSIEIARLHGFQGLDLSGVLPGQSTNMTNLGTLFDEWRNEITSEARNSGMSQLLLVMTSHHLSELESVSYPLDSMQRNLDWIHILAYDYYLPTRDKFTGAHAALYGPSTRLNTNNSITEWLNRGFQANKLVLGLPYHGYEWKLVNPNANGIGAPASGPGIHLDGSMGYKSIKAHIRDYGFGAASVYNDTYVVNFFTSGNNWINFDSVDAIRTKVLFAKQKGLLGYKVFQLANDDKWELSSAAGDEDLKKNKPRLLVIIPVTLATVILLLGIIVCFLQRIVFKKGGLPGAARKSVSKLRKRTATENIDRNAKNLQVFRFTTIKVATNDFSIENKLGEGGYGPVYKVLLTRFLV
ncbi:Chitotriosidase-1 [Melia azedarach]|uniref:Chitotriosidase-1 n=1 Tax=Melia azedarach TaxID=155640 RepID=A0ACC1Y1H0_MELAZ|nr:Chitotriosidase-1 [Melia azedarach]